MRYALATTCSYWYNKCKGLILMKAKTCNKCSTEKNIEDFSNNKRSKDGKNSWCKACFSQYRKENAKKFAERDRLYYENNKEEILKRMSIYREENKDKVKEQKRIEYENNREKYLLRRKTYYRENRAEILKEMKLYQKENRERIAEYKRNYSIKNRHILAKKARVYAKNNAESFRERNARRKALLRQNKVGEVDYEKILKRDGLFCYLCGSDIDDGDYHMDHVIPLSRGGSHSMENIKVTHARCNLIKHNKTVEEARVLIKTHMMHSK